VLIPKKFNNFSSIVTLFQSLPSYIILSFRRLQVLDIIWSAGEDATCEEIGEVSDFMALVREFTEKITHNIFDTTVIFIMTFNGYTIVVVSDGGRLGGKGIVENRICDIGSICYRTTCYVNISSPQKGFSPNLGHAMLSSVMTPSRSKVSRHL